MYTNILNQVKNADLHSARSNAIEIGDEKLISLIERLMHCDVKDYERWCDIVISHING